MKLAPFDPRRALSCLGHRSRFRLVERLVRGGCCVTELAHAVELSQSCTTRHLQALERAGLVAGTRQGKRVVYVLRQDAVELNGLLGWALGLTAAPAAAVGNGSRRAERSPRPRARPPRVPRTEPAMRPSPTPAAEPSPRPSPEPENRRPPLESADMEDWLL